MFETGTVAVTICSCCIIRYSCSNDSQLRFVAQQSRATRKGPGDIGGIQTNAAGEAWVDAGLFNSQWANKFVC